MSRRDNTTARAKFSDVTIEEIDSDEEYVSYTAADSSGGGYDEGKASAPPYDPTGAVVSYGQSSRHEVMDHFQQPIKKEDDSNIAFGDKFAKSIGSMDYAPPPPYAPSAPPLPPEEQARMEREYEAWLRERSLIKRERFEHHQQWQDNLKHAGYSPDFSPTINPGEFPQDTISQGFYEHIQDHVGESPFLQGTAAPAGFSQFKLYIPYLFEPDNDAADLQPAWVAQYEQRYQTGTYDEVQQMIEWGNANRAGTWWLAHNTIEPGNMWIISNHNGFSHGHRYELWGPGTKTTIRSVTGKSSINLVVGSEPTSPLTQYSHVQGRYTITRINPNEIGFCFNRAKNEILRLLPGRYFIREVSHNYIGKTTIVPGEITDVQVHPGNQEAFINALAQSLQVCSLQLGQLLFAKDQHGTFTISEPGVYIADRRRNYEFLNIVQTNERLLTAEDQSYHIVKLQPGEYVVFQDNHANTIVWHYNHEQPEHNIIHLSQRDYKFNGDVHNLNQGSKQIDDIFIMLNQASEFTVIQDSLRNIRFFEDTNINPIVLRSPFKYLESAPKVDKVHKINEGTGQEVVRLMQNSAEWAVTVTQGGRVELLPPQLNDEPYYLYRPNYTLIDVVNRNQEGVQRIQVPNIGEIAIVNLPSGQIGAACIENFYFFLNPKPFLPYVFTAPDKYLGTVEKNQAHAEAGDLHRIYLQPNERACVVVDGKATILPTESSDLAKENQGDGIYIFRARQKLEIHGPVAKTEKEYQLGPYHYFTVEAGEVAYGAKDGRVHIWHEKGEHCVNTSRNERFKGFFATNVDPVEIRDLEVTCKHSISSRLNLCVTYTLNDPLIAIERHGGSHDKLHDFVASMAKSIIFDLCAKRPPLGFSDSDFETNGSVASHKLAKGHADEEATDLDGMRNEFEHALKKHPEIATAGIDIGFANITAWKVDQAFLDSSREIALRLQQTHADILNGDMELRRKQQQNESDRLEAEGSRQQSTIKAEQEADITAAKARAEAAASIAREEATLKKQEMAAETARKIAEEQQKQQDIQNQTDINKAQATAEQTKLAAVAEAEAAAAAKTAETVATARAEKETADIRLATAETLSEAAKKEAEAIETLASAKAKEASLQAEAEFPGLSPQERAQLILQLKNLEAQMAIASNQKTVTHTLDPESAEQMREQQMLQFQQSMLATNFIGDPRFTGSLTMGGVTPATMTTQRGLFAVASTGAAAEGKAAHDQERRQIKQ